MSERNAEKWVIVEPGLIRLDTTEIHISCRAIAGSVIYTVRHKDIVYGSVGNLAGAKTLALDVLNDLLCMGIDP